RCKHKAHHQQRKVDHPEGLPLQEGELRHGCTTPNLDLHNFVLPYLTSARAEAKKGQVTYATLPDVPDSTRGRTAPPAPATGPLHRTFDVRKPPPEPLPNGPSSRSSPTPGPCHPRRPPRPARGPPRLRARTGARPAPDPPPPHAATHAPDGPARVHAAARSPEWARSTEHCRSTPDAPP